MPGPNSRWVGLETPAAFHGAGIIHLRGTTLTLFAPMRDPHPTASIFVDSALMASNVALRPSNALAGINQVIDAGFAEGFGRWNVRAKFRSGIALSTTDVSDGAQADERALVVGVSDPRSDTCNVVYSCPVHGEELPVGPHGGVWGAQIRGSCAGCEAALTLTVRDGAGRTIATSKTAMTPDDGDRVGADRDIIVTMTPSDEARFVTMSLAIVAHTKNGFVRCAQPQLVFSHASTLPPFALAPYSARIIATLRQVGGAACTASLEVPPEAMDGSSHNITVIDERTGLELVNSPMRCVFAHQDALAPHA